MSLTGSGPRHKYRGDVLVTPPAIEPVTAAELRAHLNGVSDTDEYLSGLITAAREEIETATGMALITQVWQMTIDRWPSIAEPWWDGVRQGAMAEMQGAPGWLRLSRWPLQDVDAVTTYSSAGDPTDVDVAATFDIDTAQHPGRLALKAGKTWPSATRATNGITVEYTAGYGDAAGDVPGPIRRAIMQLAAYAYGHRGDGCDMGDAYHASGAARVMARYTVVRL